MNKPNTALLIICFIALVLAFYGGRVLTNRTPTTTPSHKQTADVPPSEGHAPTELRHAETVEHTESEDTSSLVNPQTKEDVRSRAPLAKPDRAIAEQAKREKAALPLYHERSEEINKLSTRLTQREVATLRDVLNVRFTPQAGMNLTQFNSVKNQALDKLIAQDSLPDRLGAFIIAAYRDRSWDDLWRDYCVQHFELYHLRKWPDNPAPSDDPEAQALRQAYWHAITETDTSIAATALLGLERVTRRDPSFDRPKLERTVLDYAMNTTTPQSARIAAIQLCGVTRQAAILPTATRVAREGESIPLRMAAIATIGDVGTGDELEFLQTLLPKTSGYVRNATQKAIEKITRRTDAP